MLFFLLSTLYLYRGLTTDRLFLLFIAGLISGLNIFVRLPNLLGITLFLVIIYYELSIGRFNYKQTLKKISILISGYLFAIIGILFFMKIIGHYDLYIDNIGNLLNIMSEDSFDKKLIHEHAHGGMQFIKLFMKGHYDAIKYGIFLFFILFMILLSGKYWADQKLYKFIILVLSSLLAFLIIHLSHIDDSTYYCVYSGIVGLIYGSLLWIAYKKFKEFPEFGTIAFASFLIIELIPLGSTSYKYHTIDGMYLAIPVIMIYLFSLKEIKFGFFNIPEKSICAMRSIIIVTIIVFSMIVMNYYRANGHEIKRWTMFYDVNHPRLLGIFLTKERAETLNELVAALNKYENDFSYILTYEQISTVAYLSDLQPYLASTYPFFWTKDKIEEELEHASLKKTLPMVVRAKSDTIRKGWPKNNKPVHGGTNNHRGILRAVIESFLKKNNYQTIWENSNFEILTPR